MSRVGTHPDTGLPIYAIRSPFGPYLQCGDANDTNPTPDGCWLPKNIDVHGVSLDDAVELLKFPRLLGTHPVTGADVQIHLQASGPCIRSEIMIHGTQRHTVTKVESTDDVLTMTLERAIELLDRVGRR